jgi:hypothetical protein
MMVPAGQTRADPLMVLRKRSPRACTGHDQFERTPGGLPRTGDQQANICATTMAGAR